MISMNSRLLGVIAFLSFLIIVAQACKKETNVGSTTIPNEDLLNAIFVDTFTVEAYIEQTDSILTEKISKVAIGEFNDPQFGITRAQFFAQFLLPSGNVSFGTNPLIDSVVLSFQVDTTYRGSAQQSTTFKAYNLDESFSSSVSYYYSNNSLNYSGEIGSVLFSGDNGTVKIKLQDTVGQRLLNAPDAFLVTNTDFVSYFKGLSIKAEQASLNSGDGALYIVDPYHANTKITLYYHNDTDTLSFDLKILSSGRHFAKYEHDYSGTIDLKAQLNDKNLGKAQLFLQPLGGTRIAIRFPHLTEWAKDKHIIVHRAELVFPVQSGSGTVYPVPSATALFKDSLSILYQLSDIDDASYTGMTNPNSGVRYGGGYESALAQYRYLISRYIQKKMIYPEDVTKLILHTYSNATTPRRTIIEGTDQNKGSNRTRMLLYYSTK